MAFFITKQATEYRWIAVSSTAFRDRDHEIISTKALADDVARADATNDYGPLLWWHMKKVVIGQCDFNMMLGKSLVESGTFINKSIAQAMYKNAHNLGLSLGFTHPLGQPDSNGIFQTIQRFERSILPADTASNIFTNLAVEVPMSIKANIKKLLTFRDLVGDDEHVEAFLASAIEQEQAADDAGIASKEVQEVAMPTQIKAEEVVVEDVVETETYMMDEDTCAKIADMVVAKLAPMLAASSQKATTDVATVKATVESVQAEQAAKNAELVASVKATMDAKTKEISDLAARLKELEGDQPTGYGFQASTSPSTLATKAYSQPSSDGGIPPMLREQVDFAMKHSGFSQ